MGKTIFDMLESGDVDAYRMTMEHMVSELAIDPGAEITHPPVALSFQEHSLGGVAYPTPIVTYGNLIAIQAPPKSMKSYLTSLLSAAYLAGQGEKLGELKGHREGRRVFHFDTEQSNFHAQRVFRRTIDIAKYKGDKYHTFALRALGHRERVEVIKYCIYELYEKEEIGLVIIDGVADLIGDVNNIDESNEVVQKLMTWTQDLNCALICVIHQNYGSDKPTGHLGSALQKKAESMIKVTRDGTMGTVECKDGRNFPFNDFVFKINNYGLPEVMDTNMDVLKSKGYKRVV